MTKKDCLFNLLMRPASDEVRSRLCDIMKGKGPTSEGFNGAFESFLVAHNNEAATRQAAEQIILDGLALTSDGNIWNRLAGDTGNRIRAILRFVASTEEQLR